MLITIATQFCVLKKIEDKPVCKGAITEMINYIVTSLWAHIFDPHLACHKIRVMMILRSSAQRNTTFLHLLTTPRMC